MDFEKISSRIGEKRKLTGNTETPPPSPKRPNKLQKDIRMF